MDGTREQTFSSDSSSTALSGVKHNFQAYAHDVSQQTSVEFETPAGLKQKRRRTSPRDHAILEASYQRNSKPDKDERAELVKQVDLGEKEVQIWFQNRRQNDRRKSKPLLPHEMIPHFRNGVPNEVARQLVSPNNSQDNLNSQETEPSNISTSENTRPVSRAGSIHKLLNPSPSSDEVSPAGNKASIAQTNAMSTPPSSFEGVSPVTNRVTEVQGKAGLGVSGHSHNGSLSKKRSHEEMVEPNLSSVPTGLEENSHKLQRSSSFVRLAVTADGSFKVSTNIENTPSPPKPRQPPTSGQETRETGLRRSNSAIENGLGFKDIHPSTRRAPGRSRDARTWEFYCDKAVREELTFRAEEQENGSAVNAINIMRSGSQTKGPALSPNPGKHNVRDEARRRRGKPAFTRAQSSMARLQGSAVTKGQDPPAKGQSHDRRVSGSDSDKENWLPGTRDSHNVMRRMHPSAPRDSVLQEHELAAASRMISSRGDQSGGDHGSMSGEKAKGDDLDCIQGLLSLSQGAWR